MPKTKLPAANGMLCGTQVVPPFVVLRIVLLSPTARAVCPLVPGATLMSQRSSVVPDVRGVQVLPPLVVFRIVPPVPQLNPFTVSEKEIPRKSCVVEEGSVVNETVCASKGWLAKTQTINGIRMRNCLSMAYVFFQKKSMGANAKVTLR